MSIEFSDTFNAFNNLSYNDVGERPIEIRVLSEAEAAEHERATLSTDTRLIVRDSQNECLHESAAIRFFNTLSSEHKANIINTTVFIASFTAERLTDCRHLSQACNVVQLVCLVSYGCIGFWSLGK